MTVSLFLLVGLTVASAPSASAGSRIDVGSLPCGDPGAFALRVEDPLRAHPDWSLVVRGAGEEALRVELRGPTMTQARTLQVASSDCASLAETVVLLIESWLNDEWLKNASRVSQRGPVAAAAAPTTEPSRAQHPARIDLLLLMGAAFDRHLQRPAMSGFIGAEIEVTPLWRAGLFARHEASWRTRGLRGQLELRRLALGASAGVRIELESGLELFAMGGPALSLVSATSLGGEARGERSIALMGLMAAVRLRLALSEALAWSTQVDLLAHPYALRLHSELAGGAAEMGWAVAALTTGFDWRWEWGI